MDARHTNLNADEKRSEMLHQLNIVPSTFIGTVICQTADKLIHSFFDQLSNYFPVRVEYYGKNNIEIHNCNIEQCPECNTHFWSSFTRYDDTVMYFTEYKDLVRLGQWRYCSVDCQEKCGCDRNSQAHDKYKHCPACNESDLCKKHLYDSIDSLLCKNCTGVLQLGQKIKNCIQWFTSKKTTPSWEEFWNNIIENENPP